MGGYESSAINKPLIYTQALKKGAAKRMAETVEFWVHVTGEDAMQRDGIGFKSAIKSKADACLLTGGYTKNTGLG